VAQHEQYSYGDLICPEATKLINWLYGKQKEVGCEEIRIKRSIFPDVYTLTLLEQLLKMVQEKAAAGLNYEQERNFLNKLAEYFNGKIEKDELDVSRIGFVAVVEVKMSWHEIAMCTF